MADARDHLLALGRQKDALESQIAAIVDALGAPNLGGVSAPLVDAEGFPRADVDVHQTRTLRHQLAVLNTDHTALMLQVEQAMHALHADALATLDLSLDAPSIHFHGPCQVNGWTCSCRDHQRVHAAQRVVQGAGIHQAESVLFTALQ